MERLRRIGLVALVVAGFAMPFGALTGTLKDNSNYESRAYKNIPRSNKNLVIYGAVGSIISIGTGFLAAKYRKEFFGDDDL